MRLAATTSDTNDLSWSEANSKFSSTHRCPFLAALTRQPSRHSNLASAPVVLMT